MISLISLDPLLGTLALLCRPFEQLVKLMPFGGVEALRHTHQNFIIREFNFDGASLLWVTYVDYRSPRKDFSLEFQVELAFPSY